MTSTVQGLIVVGVFMAVVVPVVLYLLATRVWAFRPLPCRFEGMKYLAPPDVPRARVAAAVEAAADALAKNTGWSPAAIAGCFDGSTVLVVAALKWQNMAGQWVGGEQDGSIIKVGRDLSALAHEYAHLCELGIDGVRDDAHAGWAAKGIWGADNDYRAWATRR